MAKEEKLKRLLDHYPVLMADGAMGTMLIRLGLAQGKASENWNLDNPEGIESVHREYIEAGSRIILTNSFGGNPFRLGSHGLVDRMDLVNRRAAEIARRAADRSGTDVLVAGSLGPIGEFIKPLGTLEFSDVLAGFSRQAKALIEGGVDIIWIETMSDLLEVRAAVEGVRSESDIGIVVTMTFDTNGHTMMGVSPEKAVAELRGYAPDALGANCGNGPEEIKEVVDKMVAAGAGIPLIAKANAGIPELVDGRVVYNASPEDMAEYTIDMKARGVCIIGACCGSSPDHIRSMSDALT